MILPLTDKELNLVVSALHVAALSYATSAQSVIMTAPNAQRLKDTCMKLSAECNTLAKRFAEVQS